MKSKPFVFLMNKGFRNLEDRGGVQYGIQAYLEEFNGVKDVELLIKINPAYGIPNMNEVIERFRGDDPPKIMISTDSLEYKDLVNFYSRGDVFVSPTRAEAFNLPCIEAMACGLPVITTDFGGQTDYVDNINGCLIGGELTEVKHELQYEGIKWLTPSVEELKIAMRCYFYNKNIVFEKGLKAIETAKTMTWDSTADKINRLIV